MVHVGLDLSRTRLDVHVMDEAGAALAVTTAVPDRGGLTVLADRIGGFDGPVHAAIESMNGARFVHDQLELAGWQVEIADAQKVKGLAPLACKTDKIDAWVLAELSRRDLVPAIWLPTPAVRGERERARFRLHLVRHRTALKNRIHATLLAFGHPCPVSDLFGVGGRQLLARLELPEPWADDAAAALHLIDELDHQIADCERDLRRLGADHRYVPLLMTVPGIGWVLAYTIAAEIGDITRFPTPDEAGRLHRSVPARLPVRRQGPPRPAGQERTQVPALGADRSRRLTPPGTRSTPSATSAPRPGSAANAAPRSPRSTSPAASPRRSGTCSPTQPTLRSGRRRGVSGLARGPSNEMRYRSEAPPIPPGPPRRGGDREMSAAPLHPARPPPGSPGILPVSRRSHRAAGSSRVQVVVLAAARLRALHLDPLVTGSGDATRRPTAKNEERVCLLPRPPSS